MEYQVEGMINHLNTSLVKFTSDAEIKLPSGAHVKLTSKSDTEILAIFTIDIEDLTGIEKIAKIELGRISDFLSYFYDIQVLDYRVKRIPTGRVDKKGSPISEGRASLSVSTRIAIAIDINENDIVNLSGYMANNYPEGFKQALGMWRDAISKESSVVKYYLIYRLMEYVLGRGVDNWIIKKEPKVKIISDRVRGNTTIYTHLRDNVHPKQKEFPVEEINAYLNKLQLLARQAIKETYKTE